MNKRPVLTKSKKIVAKTVERFDPRGILLYFLPLPLIPAIVIGLSKGLVWNIVITTSAFAGYIIAAVLLRKGFKIEKQLKKRQVAHRSNSSLKFTSALIVAMVTGLLAFLGVGQSLVLSIILASGALLGMYFSYGFDLHSNKKIAGANGYSGDEIRQVLEESSRKIRNIEMANDKIRNAELNQRIERICDIADGILAEIEADPKELRRARKFLNVYLDGARQVTEGYAKTHLTTQSGELENNFRNVLETIENVFEEQKQKLLEDDVFDLDVQIEVLNTQLKHEGIK